MVIFNSYVKLPEGIPFDHGILSNQNHQSFAKNLRASPTFQGTAAPVLQDHWFELIQDEFLAERTVSVFFSVWKWQLFHGDNGFLALSEIGLIHL